MIFITALQPYLSVVEDTFRVGNGNMYERSNFSVIKGGLDSFRVGSSTILVLEQVVPPVALPVAPVDAHAGLAAPQPEGDGEGAAGDVEVEEVDDVRDQKEEVEDGEEEVQEEATPSAYAPKRPALVPVASKGKKQRTI